MEVKQGIKSRSIPHTVRCKKHLRPSFSRITHTESKLGICKSWQAFYKAFQRNSQQQLVIFTQLINQIISFWHMKHSLSQHERPPNSDQQKSNTHNKSLPSFTHKPRQLIFILQFSVRHIDKLPKSDMTMIPPTPITTTTTKQETHSPTFIT